MAMANLDAFEREGILENVRQNEGRSGRCSSLFAISPIVG